jgi:hypothetical protein
VQLKTRQRECLLSAGKGSSLAGKNDPSGQWHQEPSARRSLLDSQILGPPSNKLPCVHSPTPSESNVETPLNDEPERFFRASVAVIVDVAEQRHLACGQCLRKEGDLGDLVLRNLVR